MGSVAFPARIRLPSTDFGGLIGDTWRLQMMIAGQGRSSMACNGGVAHYNEAWVRACVRCRYRTGMGVRKGRRQQKSRSRSITGYENTGSAVLVVALACVCRARVEPAHGRRSRGSRWRDAGASDGGEARTR